MRRIHGFVVVAAGAFSLAANGQYYRLSDLGSLTPNGESWANGVNASREVAGYGFYDQVRRRPVATRAAGGSLDDLGFLPGGRTSWAWAINDAGQCVGVSHMPTFFAASFFAFKIENGAMVKLTDLSSGAATAAFGINATGAIVGCADPAGDRLGTCRAVRWNGNSVTFLGALGGINSYALAINAGGHIVGASELPSGPIRACLWSGGTRTDLGTLGGRASEARDINDSGLIVGWAHLPDGTRRALLWQNGAMSDLGALGTSSEARAINEHSWVVGTSWVVGEGQRAFVRSAAGVMTNLRSRVVGADDWILQHATGINDEGVIVGYGRVNGATRAFMLEPGACDADIDADGFLSGADFDVFVTQFEAGLATADFDGDGFVSGPDYDLYVQAFESGC